MTKRLILLTVLLLAVLYAAGTWIQPGVKLVGSGGINPGQGSTLALSNDGNTALVGAANDNAFWVWTRSGTTWTQQAGPLTGSGASGYTWQGSSVALSGDGNTAAIGGPYDDSNSGALNGPGAVWIWTRSGSTWTQQGSKLVGSLGSTALQGSSVALSSDGNTLLVGGPADITNGQYAGATWVWTRSGSTWTQQGEKLVSNDLLGNSGQGSSVALSSDGNTALIGAPHLNFGMGGVAIFTRSGSTWTQQQSLYFSGYSYGMTPLIGWSVSLSGDGNTALVGGYADNTNKGAAWVFIRGTSTGVWSQQGLKLIGSDVSVFFQGKSVSLSSDGNTAIIGGINTNGLEASWIWTRSGMTWTQSGTGIVIAGTGSNYNTGAVAMSGLGTTALVGSPNDGNYGTVSVLTPATNTRRVILVN